MSSLGIAGLQARLGLKVGLMVQVPTESGVMRSYDGHCKGFSSGAGAERLPHRTKHAHLNP